MGKKYLTCPACPHSFISSYVHGFGSYVPVVSCSIEKFQTVSEPGICHSYPAAQHSVQPTGVDLGRLTVLAAPAADGWR